MERGCDVHLKIGDPQQEKSGEWTKKGKRGDM